MDEFLAISIKVKISCNNISALCFQDFLKRLSPFSPPLTLGTFLVKYIPLLLFPSLSSKLAKLYIGLGRGFQNIYDLVPLQFKQENPKLLMTWKTDFQGKEQEILSHLKRVQICGRYLVLLLLPQKVKVWVSTWGYSRPPLFSSSI